MKSANFLNELPSSCCEGFAVRIAKWEFPRFFTFKDYSDKAWVMSLQPHLPPRAVSLLHLSLSLRGYGSVIQVVDLKTLGRAGSCVQRRV